MRVMVFLDGQSSAKVRRGATPAAILPNSYEEAVEGRLRRSVRIAASQHQGELTLILGDQLIAWGQELEDGHHGLTGLLADSFAIALDQFKAKGKGVGILSGGGQGFGQGELELEVLGMSRQGGPGGLDAAGTLRLGPEGQLGLEPLGLGLKKTPSLQGGQPGCGVLDLPLRQGDSRQADLGLGQVGLKLKRLCHTSLRRPSGRSFPALGLQRRATRPRSARVRSIHIRMTDSGCTPTNASATAPSLTPKTAGMDRTPNWPATSGLRSMSTFASTNLPPYSRASFSRTGLSILQGPHQGAQKSTTTGTVRGSLDDLLAKVSETTSMTSGHGEDAGDVSLITWCFLTATVRRIPDCGRQRPSSWYLWTLEWLSYAGDEH